MPRRLNNSVLPLSISIVVTSLLYVLCFPSHNHPWIAWVTLIPLALVAIQSTPGSAFKQGWLSGTLAYMGLLSWLIDTFKAAGQSQLLALSALVALATYLGLYWGAWTAILSISVPVPVPNAQRSAVWRQAPAGDMHMIVGAAAWVALEYLRTHLFSGFPWVLFADSQVRMLPLIQVASLAGVYAVSFLVVLVNLSLVTKRRRPILFSLGLILVLSGWGLLLLRSEPVGVEASATPPVAVALLQGNIDQYRKWDDAYVDEIKTAYAALVEKAAPHRPDLMIWPETSVPGYLLQEPPLRHWLTELIRKSGTHHLVGTPLRISGKSFNAAFSISPEGSMEGTYAKTHLVPFGEIVPWSSVLGRWIPVLNALGGFSSGHWPPVIQVGMLKVGVSICYEAIFPNLIRRSVAGGAEVLANMTNDAWYMNTAAPYQHLAPNVYRAVENRRWLLRANNTGISAVIDPYGRILMQTRLFEPTILHADVYPRQSLTLYTRTGDWFAWLCLLAVLIVSGRAILRRARKQTP